MIAIRTIGTILLLAIAGTIVRSQERATSPVTLDKVSNSVYQINGGKGSNGGMIICEGGVVVIDSKMNKESVEQSIEAINMVTDKSIRFLVNTHSDGDHIFGNRYFPSSLTFVAHDNCRDDFFKKNFGRESDWEESENYPFTPSLSFEKNLNLWMGKNHIELHYFGVGHTTGDIVVYVPQEKVAFIGDLYFSDRPQLIHSVKNGNSFEYVKTMTKMLETLDAEIFLSGHSDPVGPDKIQKHIQSMVERQEKVKEFIQRDKTLTEILEEFQENETRLVTSIFNEIRGK